MRCLPIVLVTVATAMAITAAPLATATPTCVDIAPMTTQCHTPGNSQIVTSPPERVGSPWGGWPYGYAFDYPW